jgi:cold shock CspA family protein/ribosome-associated translation inhibitor RaiA
MQVPLEIAFHDVEKSDWMEEEIRNRAAGLDAVYGRLTAVRVRMEKPHRSQRTGNLYECHIEMSVPGKSLVVSRAPHHAEDKYSGPAPDVAQVIRESFDAAEKQLKAFKEQIGGDVKRHAEDGQMGGQVSILEEDHGFVLTNTGGQLYFHRNSVLGDGFEALRRGDHVHYIETTGDTGPIANKVRKAAPQSPA